MAFFTTVNTNVPFLPSDECQTVERCRRKGCSDGEQQQRQQQERCLNSEVRENADGVDDNNRVNKETGRYEYVVDRVLGVEV